MIRLGIVGLSEGNGHPFSFSAIVNGYDAEGFRAAGWPVILDYLQRRTPEEFGFPGVQVTHAWTQDPATTERLCRACRIGHGVADPAEMLGQVDALVIGRDDWETHAALAMPFLERGTPVFCDKPLTLAPAELERLSPYLRQGRLMSTSGLRYARELDEVRADPRRLGDLRLVSATVLNNMERYGIHMLDAVAGLGLGPVTRVTRLDAPHEAFLLRIGAALPFLLNCLGNVAKTFHVSLFGDQGHAHVDLHDNFSAFRRTLAQFIEMVRTGRPPIPPDETIRTMRLIAGARALAPGDTLEVPP